MRGVYEKIPGSGVWYIRYSDAEGRIRKEKAGTKSAARKLYTVRRGAAVQGIKYPAQVKRIKFSELAKAAQEYSDLHKKSAKSDEYRMKLLNEWFGDRAAADIRPQEIEKRLTQAALDNEWTPATRNRYKALLSLVLRLGVQNGKIPSNPARLVRPVKEDNQVVRWLNPDEENKLKLAIDDPVKWAVVTLALHTGCRAGELFRLKWSEVRAEQVTLLDTKNGTMRHVPLNESAQDALTVLKTAGTEGGYVCPQEPYKTWFDGAVAKAEIQGFTFHCLRHTFASRLVMAGVDLTTVSKLMGHKALTMTLRYAHLAPQHMQDAVKKLAKSETGPTGGPNSLTSYAKTG